MDWSLAGKPERAGPVEIEDLRKDLLQDFSALTSQDGVPPQTENLQVFLRIRPFTSTESDSGEAQDCVSIEGPDTVILKAPRSIKSLPQTGQKFTFTQVFGPDSSQRAVFDGSVRSLVRDVLDGGNCLVFTYGVTNAGKTFTFLGPDHDSGLLPRSLTVIFNSLEGRLYSGCDLKPLRCRDYTRLTPEQQNTESATKRTLLKLFKESDRSLTAGKSNFLDGSNMTDSSLSSSDNDSFVVDVSSTVRFSIWVSFCEIYNDNIHDLLQHVPQGHQKRTVLRLSQDVKGNSFIKDLRWVAVNSFDEAYRIMKIGKKNQSMSSTRLNQLSSRSHSIFSVRLMKIDNAGVPRVLSISELALCDLAGSERCSRTHNTGDRLKEAGNINNSLLTLSKCISAMRTNQHAKFQQHVPFRESKLTHFLQFFFCGSGSGRVTMVVNINQSASCFDETLNVLKFSALAQKVVVLNSRPPLAAALPRSAMEVSLIIDEADARRFRSRRSSLLAWDTSLEDVQETDSVGEEEVEEEESVMEVREDDSELEATVLEATVEDTTVDQEPQSDRGAALRLVLEAQIREEVSAEFMDLFNKMEKDYSERLEKEREILEERAERRVEILQNLVHRTVDLTTDPHRQEDGVVCNLSSAQDPQKIRDQGSEELRSLRLEKQETQKQLQEFQESLERQGEQVLELGELCRQKDEIISKLTSALDQTVEDATRQRLVVEAVRAELLQFRHTCSCTRNPGRTKGDTEERTPTRDSSNQESAPSKRRGLLEEEIWRLQEENELKEQLISNIRAQQREEREEAEQQISQLQQQQREEAEQWRGEEAILLKELELLKKENSEMEARIQQLSEEACPDCDSVFQSLEAEQRETCRLNKENKALVNGIFTLQTQVTELQKQLRSEMDRSLSLSEELNTTNTRLHSLQSQSDDRDLTIRGLRDQVENLTHQNKFQEAMDRLKEESESVLKKSVEKNRQIQELQEKLQLSERLCAELKEQSSNQTAAFQHVEAELKERRVSFERRLDTLDRENLRRGRENADLLQLLAVKEQTVAEAQAQMETLRTELEHLREQLQDPEDEKENQGQPQDQQENHEELHHQQENHEELHHQQENHEELHHQQENHEELHHQQENHEELHHQQENHEELHHQQENREELHHQQENHEEVEQRTVTVVEELREELRKHQQRRNNNRSARKHKTEPDENLEEEKLREQRRVEAVKREVQRFRELQNHNNLQRAVEESPEKASERRRTPRTTGRKRKSCEVQGLVFSENKRNRSRAALKQASSSSVKDKPLTKLGELIHKSPSFISSKAKDLVELVVDGRSSASKLKRGRRKLYRPQTSPALTASPLMGSVVLEEKESDHVTIKRQLRSKRK